MERPTKRAKTNEWTPYPPEMSEERAREYRDGKRARPLDLLLRSLGESKEARTKITTKNVIHWFRNDLRLHDNTALQKASHMAKEADSLLITLYLVSPQDYIAHSRSSNRVNFVFRTLGVLQKDLAQLDIPLVVDVVDERKNVQAHLLQMAREWNVSHIFANMEYEVDEVRRDAKFVRGAIEHAISADFLHDQCIVAPGKLESGAGRAYSVYSPWYRAFVAHVQKHPQTLDLAPRPERNSPNARKQLGHLFQQELPPIPHLFQLSPDVADRMKALWPAGEHEAMGRLQTFIAQRINRYQSDRNFPDAKATSCLSAHFAAGTLSPRLAVCKCREANMAKAINKGDEGVVGYIGELAWRDFYKHVLCAFPHVGMSKPFKIEFSKLQWDQNPVFFDAWCNGKTGFPIVDAAIRQLNHTGYMHNRCRMIVASFLSKHLMLDWRLGERYFMEQLIDGDMASDNGGWGFSASVGVDPQPYFRIFNPLLQSEKFAPEGEYIRTWVPELASVESKAVHAPYDRMDRASFAALGYPKPIVDHKTAREKALARYKAVSA